MTAGEYRAALAALPLGTVADLVGRDPFLVVAPHPDDETLGCGGLLAAAERAGVPGRVLILTDGAGSHPNSASHPPERLVALRRREAEAALRALGLPDGRLDQLALRDAATPADGPEFDAAVDAVAARAAAAGARTLFVTWNRDPHCDHETGFAMARAAAARLGLRLWAYPIWGLHLPPGAELDEATPQGLRLDVSADRARKRRAIDCHASQVTGLIADDPEGFVFTEAQLAPFLGDAETFIRIAP